MCGVECVLRRLLSPKNFKETYRTRSFVANASGHEFYSPNLIDGPKIPPIFLLACGSMRYALPCPLMI